MQPEFIAEMAKVREHDLMLASRRSRVSIERKTRLRVAAQLIRSALLPLRSGRPL